MPPTDEEVIELTRELMQALERVSSLESEIASLKKQTAAPLQPFPAPKRPANGSVYPKGQRLYFKVKVDGTWRNVRSEFLLGQETQAQATLDRWRVTGSWDAPTPRASNLDGLDELQRRVLRGAGNRRRRLFGRLVTAPTGGWWNSTHPDEPPPLKLSGLNANQTNDRSDLGDVAIILHLVKSHIQQGRMGTLRGCAGVSSWLASPLVVAQGIDQQLKAGAFVEFDSSELLELILRERERRCLAERIDPRPGYYFRTPRELTMGLRVPDGVAMVARRPFPMLDGTNYTLFLCCLAPV